jgi:uncharacterized protein (TIGR00369 family)
MNSMPHAVQDPGYDARVRASFARQAFMATLGAEIARIEPGRFDIRMPIRDAFTQQHGFVHAGVLASIGDSACGYAAATLMPADVAVLSIEFKINLLAPARGEMLVARAHVVRAGRTVTVCQAEIVAVEEGQERVVATLTGTMMTVRDRPELRG